VDVASAVGIRVAVGRPPLAGRQAEVISARAAVVIQVKRK
jgi:hypothetical protein